MKKSIERAAAVDRAFGLIAQKIDARMSDEEVAAVVSKHLPDDAEQRRQVLDLLGPHLILVRNSA